MRVYHPKKRERERIRTERTYRIRLIIDRLRQRLPVPALLLRLDDFHIVRNLPDVLDVHLFLQDFLGVVVVVVRVVVKLVKIEKVLRLFLLDVVLLFPVRLFRLRRRRFGELLAFSFVAAHDALDVGCGERKSFATTGRESGVF